MRIGDGTRGGRQESLVMLRVPQHLTTLQNDGQPRASICGREDV